MAFRSLYFFFFFNDTATTEIYTLSLHDALPISVGDRDSVAHRRGPRRRDRRAGIARGVQHGTGAPRLARSEEHTSELQSRLHLVCRLLLEKKNEPANSTPRAVRIGERGRDGTVR